MMKNERDFTQRCSYARTSASSLVCPRRRCYGQYRVISPHHAVLFMLIIVLLYLPLLNKHVLLYVVLKITIRNNCCSTHYIICGLRNIFFFLQNSTAFRNNDFVHAPVTRWFRMFESEFGLAEPTARNVLSLT